MVKKIKTKVMPSNFTPGPAPANDNAEIRIGENFRYLRTILTSTRFFKNNFATKFQKAYQTLGRLHKMWKSNRLRSHTKNSPLY